MSTARCGIVGLLVLGLLAGGCIHPPTSPRLSTPMPVSLVFVVDHPHDRGIAPPPPELKEAVAARLKAMNLEPTEIPFAAFAGRFGTALDTKSRFAIVSKLSSTPRLLLVEAQADYFSEIGGRYRWTVAADLTLGEAAHPEQATTQSAHLTAILRFDHQKEQAAIASVSDAIADRAADMFDSLLAPNAADAQPASPAPGASDAGASASLEPKGYDAIYFALVDRFADGDRTNDRAIDRADPAAFHGGDIQGVLDHLDDLQSLGVRTVWLSPIFASQQTEYHGWGAYHGYWVEDLARMEPRFGTVALLRKLSDALHRRHMRLVLDLVLNHVAYDSKLPKEHPDWFHHDGPVKDWNDPVQVVNGAVMGLPDLAQENPAVFKYLLATSLRWIDRVHPDGFRLDAVKHVPLAFWARFNAAVRARAGPKFMLLGEMLDGDPKVLSKTARDGKFGAVFDFPLHFAMVDVFCKGSSPLKLATVLSQDRLYPDPSRLVTLLDNHDLPRILTACQGSVAKVTQALRFQLTARGIPSLTYGTESGLEGAHDPANRADMRFDPRAPERAVIARLLALRKAHPALLRGADQLLQVNSKSLVYARVTPDEAAVIAVNGSDAARSFSVNAHGAASATAALTGAKVDARNVQVPPHQVGVFLLRPKAVHGFSSWARRANAQWRTGVHRRGVEIAGPDGAEVVGSGPELGDWKPAEGVRLKGGRAKLELPVGAAFAFKLVRKGAKGTEWEPGGNRTLWVGPGTKPLRLKLAWGRRRATTGP